MKIDFPDVIMQLLFRSQLRNETSLRFSHGKLTSSAIQLNNLPSVFNIKLIAELS